jgi:hypothetical protein
MSNIINFEQERLKREVSQEDATEGGEAPYQSERAPQYAIRETHFENGTRALELLDGQLLQFDYVDTRAIIASHEAVTKDREMRGAKEVHEYISQDAPIDAHALATEHIDDTAKQAIDVLTEQPTEPESNDVFARTFREFTSKYGSSSLLRLRTIPNWSWAERNQGELTTSLKSGLAFAIPKELAKDMIAILQYQSSFGFSNSNERTKGTFATGKPRGGDDEDDLYMSIPVTLGDGEIVQLYFLFADTNNDSQKNTEHSSTVDRLAA